MNPFYPAFIQGIGGPELLIILVIILLLFGAKKLPELAKGLCSRGANLRIAIAEPGVEIESAFVCATSEVAERRRSCFAHASIIVAQERGQLGDCSRSPRSHASCC